jgi:anti-anti-sigma regulatory factor
LSEAEQPEQLEPVPTPRLAAATVSVEHAPGGSRPYVAAVKLCGEHDLATLPEVVASLAPLHGNILVDLSECEFIDVSTIGRLKAKQRALQREGFALDLLVPAERVELQHLFSMLRLSEEIALYQTP